MITVAIIEDNRLVREGITDMLNGLPDVEAVLAATSFETTTSATSPGAAFDFGNASGGNSAIFNSSGLDSKRTTYFGRTIRRTNRLDGV